MTVVVFDLGTGRYALPLAAVERVFPVVAVTPLPGQPEIALGAFNLRGTPIPVVDLRRRFGIPKPAPGIRGHLLVAATSRRRLALPVDEVLGVQELPDQLVLPPERLLPELRHLSGIAAGPDGLLLIQDLERLLSLEEERRLDEALGAS